MQQERKLLPPQPPMKPVEYNLTSEEQASLFETFQMFNQNSSLDVQAFKKSLEDLGVLERNNFIKQIVQDLEKADNHYLSPYNFYEIISNRVGNNKTKEGIFKLFQSYDPEDTGFIDFANLKRVAKQLGETFNDDELQEMIHHIHILRKTESPEKISFDEFYEIITAPRRY